MTLDSWNIGFQADLYQQNGGFLPTVALQSTLTRSIPEAPLSATSTTTRGFLAGVRYTNTVFDSPLPKVKPAVVGHYQWDSNWKLTGRAGVQSFGGAPAPSSRSSRSPSQS
jgi:hypothetical protein